MCTIIAVANQKGGVGYGKKKIMQSQPLKVPWDTALKG